MGVPVVIVGGITVGGAGKTPLTLALVEALRSEGFVPGIVSRGYGSATQGCREVTPDSTVTEVGDEPLLMRLRAECPVFVGADRVMAAHALRQKYPEVDVLFSDDGLQHYRLARDCELVVLDRRGMGNGWQLPAGPLREPPRRLRSADAVVLNQAPALPGMATKSFAMQLNGASFYHLHDPSRRIDPAALQGQTLHAVAGIGAPDRFFDHLRAMGLSCECHPFPDHHRYVRDDVLFASGAILTTEKDAVKLRAVLGPDANVWVLPVSADIPRALIDLILEKLHGRTSA